MMMEEDQIADRDAVHVFADLDRPADHFMAKHGADLAGQIPRHQVAGTDAANRRANDDVSGTLQAGRCGFDHFETIRSDDAGLSRNRRQGRTMGR
jgi:hypothetical protein